MWPLGVLGEERPCTAQHREEREEDTHRAKLTPDTPWFLWKPIRQSRRRHQGFGTGGSPLLQVPLLGTNPPCFVSTPDLRWEYQTRQVSSKQASGMILFLELPPDRQKLRIRFL